MQVLLSPLETRFFECCAAGDVAGLNEAIALGVDPCVRDGLGRNALWRAASAETVAALLARGVPVVEDVTNQTPLHAAPVALLSPLARAGRSYVGAALLAAAEDGNVAACRALLRHCDGEDRDARGLRALHVAAKTGRVDVVEVLLECVDAGAVTENDQRRNALHLAVIGGHAALVAFLMESDPELAELRDGQGNLPRDYDVERKLFPALSAPETEGVAAVSGDAAAVVAASSGYKVVLFEDEVMDLGAGVSSSELESRANAFFAANAAVALVSSSLSTLYIPPRDASAPGRIRRTLAVVVNVPSRK